MKERMKEGWQCNWLAYKGGWVKWRDWATAKKWVEPTGHRDTFCDEKYSWRLLSPPCLFHWNMPIARSCAGLTSHGRFNASLRVAASDDASVSLSGIGWLLCMACMVCKKWPTNTECSENKCSQKLSEAGDWPGGSYGVQRQWPWGKDRRRRQRPQQRLESWTVQDQEWEAANVRCLGDKAGGPGWDGLDMSTGGTGNIWVGG